MPKKHELPPITTLTEGDYNGLPTLALPTSNSARPVIMTIGKWRTIQKNWPQVEAWLKKHEDFDILRKTAEPLSEAEIKRKTLLAELAAL